MNNLNLSEEEQMKNFGFSENIISTLQKKEMSHKEFCDLISDLCELNYELFGDYECIYPATIKLYNGSASFYKTGDSQRYNIGGERSIWCEFHMYNDYHAVMCVWSHGEMGDDREFDIFLKRNKSHYEENKKALEECGWLEIGELFNETHYSHEELYDVLIKLSKDFNSYTSILGFEEKVNVKLKEKWYSLNDSFVSKSITLVGKDELYETTLVPLDCHIVKANKDELAFNTSWHNNRDGWTEYEWELIIRRK